MSTPDPVQRKRPVFVYLDAPLRTQAEEAAEAEQLSLSSWARRAIARQLYAETDRRAS